MQKLNLRLLLLSQPPLLLQAATAPVKVPMTIAAAVAAVPMIVIAPAIPLAATVLARAKEVVAQRKEEMASPKSAHLLRLLLLRNIPRDQLAGTGTMNNLELDSREISADF